MRKTIITVIATIVLIAPFEKAKGQTTIVSADFPTTNVLTGVNAKLSFGLWRFEPFLGIGQYLQIFEESITIGESSVWYVSRFTNAGLMLNFGTNFRITDNNRIRFGVRTIADDLGRGRGTLGFIHSYLGYIRTQPLSERISLDLFLHATVPFPYRSRVLYLGDSFWDDFHFHYSAVIAGVRLNYKIANNLRLNVRLDYTRRYNVSFEEIGIFEEWLSINSDKFVTRNLIDFSVGIHFHFGRQRQQPQQVAHRQPRQRVAPSRRPTHLVAPSTFNHPTLPPRTR